LNKKAAGFMGELSPEAITNFGILMPICALELDLGIIQEALSSKKRGSGE
jgi:phenylalanyl-tRNA synthetase beta subunit